MPRQFLLVIANLASAIYYIIWPKHLIYGPTNDKSQTIVALYSRPTLCVGFCSWPQSRQLGESANIPFAPYLGPNNSYKYPWHYFICNSVYWPAIRCLDFLSFLCQLSCIVNYVNCFENTLRWQFN